MSPITKNAVAAAILAGAAVVWTPRLTGWDPLGLYATSSTPTAEGTAVSPVDHGDSWLFASDPASIETTGAEAAAATTSNVDALEAVLGFLETRTPARPTELARATDAVRPGADRSLESTQIDTFLARNPLLALAIGPRRSSALFGRTQVTAGDTLGGGAFVVHAIERGGVVLDTPTGRVTVHLNRSIQSTTSAAHPFAGSSN